MLVLTQMHLPAIMVMHIRIVPIRGKTCWFGVGLVGLR